MPGPALLLSNPASHTVAKRGSVLARVASPAARHEQIDFARLDEQTSGAGIVAVEGGDGTVMAVTHALMMRAERTGEAPPPAILVAGGRTDLVARHLGCPRDPDVVARLLERPPKTRVLRPLRMDHDNGTAHGWFVSTGAIPRGAAYAHEVVYESGSAGSVSVAATLAGVLLNPRRFAQVTEATPFDADLTGTPFGPGHRFMLATTLPKLMVGLDPFWGQGDGAVRVTLAKANAEKVRRTFARVWTGMVPKDIEARGYISRNLPSFTYETDGLTLVDGEQLALEGRVTVSAAGPMRFLVP